MRDGVTQHAIDVVEGKRVSGNLHRLACKRHLDNLEKQNTTEFPYHFDIEKSNEIIEYAETLTLAEGDEPKPLILVDEQRFDLGCTFGWIKNSTGKRRFRRRYKSVARQNGKTLENGIMGTYIAGFGGYKYGKLFTAATKRKQAKLTWEEMQKFIEIDPDLSNEFEIKEYKHLITATRTKCTIEALSRDSGLEEGFRGIFSSIDEIHQHPDNRVYKNLYNGTRALDETLVSMITTRGDKTNSFCKEMDDYCVKILKGLTTAEDFFVDIYALDENDDWQDEKNWIKANYYLCTKPESVEQMRMDAQTAKDMGGAELKDFLIKALNMWVNQTDDNFISADDWQKCGSDKTVKDFKGKACYVGIDLSHGGDLTTYALEFPKENDGAYWFSHSFLPKGRFEEHIETDIAPYDLWETQELITVTGGETDFKNDYKFIIKQLHELKEEYDLNYLGIGIDPHNADGILSDLEEFGCPVVIVTQSCRNLNDAVCDIQLLTKSGTAEYDKKNELLTYSFMNASIVRNSFGEIKVDKKPGQRFKRIDPVDACVDAHYVRIKNKKEEIIDTNKEMENYLKLMKWG